MREIYLDLLCCQKREMMLSRLKGVFLFDLNTHTTKHTHTHTRNMRAQKPKRHSERSSFSVRAEDKHKGGYVCRLDDSSSFTGHKLPETSMLRSSPGRTKYYKFAIIFIVPVSFKRVKTARWPRLLTDIISYFYLFLSPLSVVKS